MKDWTSTYLKIVLGLSLGLLFLFLILGTIVWTPLCILAIVTARKRWRSGKRQEAGKWAGVALACAVLQVAIGVKYPIKATQVAVVGTLGLGCILLWDVPCVLANTASFFLGARDGDSVCSDICSSLTH